ncbi:Uncharacterized protein OBRU01_00308 [Operophtera brumata]|uniref:Uncharacterized protein n=1 Tax=Operophtera brumata TaxID=104452 RepID=A0A0L7LVD9_OPEBR|nr:Uncharacterized protein OBRU01_00308 [Operophtera brumata]
MKARQNQANVLSTAILNEGEALGLSPELCQDITVLLSGPRVKTLSWDMDSKVLGRPNALQNCRAYLERTHGGTKAVTTELKYLNLNPADFQYLPEEDEDENNIYYGIEKGYEHLVEHEPQDIWEEAYEDFDKANTNYSSDELHFIQAQRKKKNKKAVSNSDEDDPLSFMAETKRKEKKERPHSKERSKEKKKVIDPLKKVPGESKESGEIKIPGDPLEIKEGSQEKNKDKPKRVRKKKEKVTNPSEGSLAGLIGLKVAKTKKKSAKKIPHLTDSICADSQGISSIKSNSEDNVLYDGLFSMDEMKSRGSQSSDSMGLHEFPMPNERVGIIKTQTVFNRPQRPASVSGIRIASQSPNKSHSYMSYSPAPYKSPTPSDYSRNNSSTLAKQEVKSSISKLLEFRRLNVLEAGKKPNAIMRPEGSIAIDNNISPKAVTIPEIPKSYISKQQSEKLTELKQKVDDIMKHRKNTDSAIPSPVIQYASKNFTNPGRPSDSYYDVPCQYNKHQMDRMTPSSSSNRCFSTPPPSDRFLDSVNLISIYDKNEPSYSRNYFPGKTSPYSDVSQDRQSNCDMSDINYQEYLHELRKKNTFNQYAEKTEPKKAMKPINRVTPVVPNMKSEHKPQHGGKQMPQKKPDGSLNTFSRLSYYKNKQTDMRNKTQDMPPQNLPHTVGSLQSQRSDKQISPSNDVQTMTGKYEKPQTKTRDHPMLTNMLQSNSSRPQNQQKPVLPQQTILSEKDQNDLLLLLRQQSSLNKPHNSPSMASCCKPTPITQNSALASCSIMITSTTDTIYNSHPSVMPSNPNLMHNSHPSVMPSNPNLMPLNHQIGKPIETNKTVNESKMINVLSTSIIKPADSKNGPKPVNTKKPTGQEKSKKTEGKGQMQIAAKPVPSAHKTPEEWENVMNAILKQKTPCRGPNALDMTLNKSSFEKAFEESLRKPPALFMSPNSCSAQKNISIIEYNHQNFVKNTESMATSSSTSETIKNKEKKSRSLLKNTKPPSQPTMKSKLKISANTANMIEKLKEKNKVEATIEKLMQQNHIEINIKNANITQIDILEKALKQSNIETPKLVTQQRNVTPTIDVQQSSFEVPKKVVKQNPVVIPKKDVKQVVEPKKEANQGVEILKKIHPEVQMKQFTHAGPKQDDPFISGIPNSDYDLLDELIDDDLRKEIGELSSDEESYNVAAQGCLKDNKTDKKTASFVYNNPLNDIVTKHPLNDVAKAPPVISARPSFARKSNQHRPNKKEPTLTKMSPARPALHKPVMCLNATNVKNVTTHIVSKPTQTCTYNANVLHNSQITVEPNIYVPRPVPVQNVVLLPSDLMYEGYSTVQTHVQAVKNIATNSYMTVNNAPCVNQTNQFTAPLVNSLIIASAVSHVPSDTTVQSKPVTKVTQSRNSSANSELLQPTNSAIAQGNIVVDDNKLDAKASSSKSNHVIQNDVQKKLETKADLNISKSGERKVLKEVQEKHADDNNDYTKRTQKVSAKDLNTQADQERVRKKRMDILNRKICHFSGIQTIALSYSPLQLSIQKVKKDVDAVDKKVTEEEDLPTNQNGLQELNNEVQSPATPDSYKENKNETSQVRRILLRSSNKPKNKIITPTMASKQSLDKKLKGPPAVYLDTPNKIPSKNDQINTETNNKKKPVLKIIRNKSVTTSKDTKNKETKTKGTRTLKVPKNNKLNNISSTIENPAPNQDFDIEAELLGSTIPKMIPTDLDSSNPTEVGSAKTKDEDIFVTYMLSAKKYADSLPIQVDELQQGKDLTDTKTTKSSELLDSLKPSIPDKEEPESLPIKEGQLQQGKYLTVNKTTKYSGDSFKATIFEKEKAESLPTLEDELEHGKDLTVNKTTKTSKQLESFRTTKESSEITEIDSNTYKTEQSIKTNDHLVKTTDASILAEDISGETSVTIKEKYENINDKVVAETIDKVNEFLYESTKSNENNDVMISNQVNGQDSNIISKELSPIESVESIKSYENNNVMISNPVNGPDTNTISKELSTIKNINFVVDNAPKIPSPDQKAKLQQSKSINDSIVIEHLHTGDNNDPLKKSFRITMGNRKTYVGTISGSVNIETILDDPYVKSQLMSQFEQPKKLYSLKLNVNKNASNGIKIFPTRKIQQEITPLETVSLLSDDEEEDSLQVLETEYGNYKINSIDHGIFTKHQNKFKLKSFVPVIKLSLEEENAIKRRSETNLKDDASLNINNINEECVIIVDDDTINLENPSGLVCCDKLEDINILSAIPSKYVKGIFSDIENILAPLNKKPQGEPVVLIDDSSNDSLDLNQKPKPIEKIDELKNMLLKDLGVVHNISKSTDDVQVTWASEAIDLTNDPAMEPTDYCSFEAQIDNKEDYQKIMNRKYFVKLVRCDYMVNQPKSELIEVEDYKSDESDVAIPAPVSRSGSFSILEDFPVVDDNDKISEYGLERSSPVMEVYDIITSLEGKLPTNRSIHKMSVDSLKCDSEWMNTKKTEHLHCLSDLRLKRDMSSQSLGVPKLATLILTFIQKGDLVNKYNSLTRLHSSPKPIKRKSSKPSLFPIAKIPKLEKIPDKPHSRSVHDTLSYPTEAKVADVCNTLVTAATPTYCETLSYPTEAEIDVNNTIVTAISQSSVVDEYANDVTVSGDLGMETSQSETPSFKASEYLIDKFSSPEKVLDDYGLNKYANLECNIGLVTLKKDKLYCSNVTKDVVKQIVDSKSSSDAVERLIYSDIDDEGFLTKSYATVHSEIQAENISESEEVIGDVFLVPKICEGTFEKYVGENQSMDQLEVLITSTGCEKTDLGINIEIQKTDEPVDTTFTDKTNSKQATDSFETQMDDKHYFPDKFVNESINVQEPEDTESSKMTNEEEHSDITTAKLEKESTNSIPVENNSVQLQNDPKNKSTDTFFDALNEMFGDSGPMDINNVVVTKHEPKKALCISNEQNESCIAKNNEQKETCDLVIEKSIESRDIESAKMSKLEVRIINTTMKLDENSAQEVKQPDKDTTTKKENHAINNTTHLPQTTDEIDVALKKMFGKPKDTNFIDVSENVVIESCEYISTNNICTMWNDENLVLSAADDYNDDARNTLREELSPMEDYDGEILVVDLPNDEKNNIKTIPTLDCTHHVKESVENKVEQNLKPGFKKAIDVAVAAKGIEIESDISAEKCDSSMNITINNEDGASSKLSSQNTIGNAEDLKQQHILDNTNLVLDASLNVKLSDQDNEIKMFEDNTKQTMGTQDMKEIEENSGGIDNKRKYILDANLESDVCLKLETDDQYVEIKQKLHHDNIVHTLDTHDMKEIEKNNVVDNLNQKDILDKAHLEQDCSLKLETADEEIKIEDEIESTFANYCINIDYEKRVSNEFNDKNLILDASLNVEISDQDNVFKILDTIKTMDTLDLKEIQENVIDNLKRKDILDANFESEVSLKQTADQDIEIKKELLRDNIVPTLDAHDSKEIEKNNVVDNLQRKHILNKGNLESDGILKVETHDEELKIEDEIESTENTNIEKRVSNELNAQNNLDKYLVLTRKEVPVVGIENKDPDFETRYAFSMLNDVPGTYEINSQTNESKESTSNYCENEIIENTKLVVPKHTYAYTSNSLYNEMVRRSSRNIKRKKDMSDIKTTVKKYRKGKNIDYPKISAAAIADLAYAKEYKRIIDYCSTIKFSYARPFHIESIDVGDMLKAWPIQNCHSVEVKDSNNVEELLYTDAEDTENAMAITDPLIQTLNEEIVNGDNVNNYNSIDINETNFKMGFGEMSGRVIKKIETGITKLSAATLSDVKQYQPFSIPDESKVNPNLAHEIETQRVKFSHFMNLINVKEKLQSVFKKTAVELTKEFLKDKKYAMNESQLEFPFGLTSTEFMEVPSIESIVNVVQGQLPVSASAQNPVTCDPRVTHVSDASPSQCSDNSPGEDSVAIMATEYTELTTANITLPSVQEYGQPHQSPHSHEQNSPGTDNDINESTPSLSIVKIELVEEETSQENQENEVLGNDFSPLPHNNVEYSFEDTSNNMFNTSANADHTSTNTDNTSNNNMFNKTTNLDNTFTNVFNNSTNMDNAYMDNTPSSMESTYTNMDKASISMYSTSSNLGNSTTEVDNTANMDDASPNISLVTKTNVNNTATNIDNASGSMDSNYTNVYAPMGSDSSDISNTPTNVGNTAPNMDSSPINLGNRQDPQPQDLSMGNSSQESKICNTFEGNSQENGKSKSDQIAHAMNAAGISSETVITSGADELVNLMTQGAQVTANNFSKSTPINVMTLQHALAQVLPPPLNQTSTSENQIPNNPVTQQVLHIVQGTNAQTVINKPNGTHLLHILQNKSNPVANGLSLVDTGLQQGGNQLIHIVNNGNQNNAQFLKRVNLLTNLTNAQGSNEQKMIQFVCKSADGKSIQLNAGHQRSMVLRLHPTSVQTAPKPTDPQDLRASTSAVNSENSPDPNQEIKSRSVYEENYAQFIQNSAPTSGSSATICQEKATSLPKFNQVFGKQSYQENQNEINQNGLQENTECAPEENNAHLEQPADVNNPPLLVRNAPPETTQAQPNPVQQIKQTISPMNIHTTMHGGVIYTRQIPVNIGGGQTINLITVPSTELTDDLPQKQQTGGAFVNQEGEQSSIIKLVPHHTPNVSAEENKVQASSNETNHTPQPQPVLTQMRIKLPMLSKGPHLVPGARLVRPSFFQIQRNVIGGTNQPVYQQLVLTTAPSLGQSIRLPAQQPHSSQSPQAQPILVQTAQHPQPSPHIPVQQVQHAPSSQHAQSAKQAHSAPQTPQPQSVQPDHTKPINEPDSELSTLTLEQLREFDMVLEQVKERSVQPTPSTTPSTPVLPKPAPADSTDGPALATTSVSESTQQVIYSVEKQPTNVVSYVNRKSTITSATTSFVRSPDSSGIVETPSSSTQVQITHTVTSKSTTADGGSAVVAHSKKKKKKKSSSSTTAIASLGSPTKTNSLKPQEDEQTTQRILYILAEYKEQVENSPDKNKPAPRRRNQFPPTTGSKRKRSHCSSRASCRREGVEMSPIHGENGENGEDSLITLGSEDSSCGTTFSECTDCQESHSPEESPTKVVRRLTFEQETTTQITQTRTIPQRNVIVGDGQTITVARTTTATTAKPTTTVLMPANYLVPVSMIKGGQQIAIMTNRGPKILVGAGETNAGALLFQRLIGPGLKPVLTRPGVRHIRLPATALHNLQTFNIQTTPVTQVQPPDNTAQEASTPAPPDLVDTRAMSSPWHDREARDKPERGPSPDCTEPWNLPSSSIADDYGYEEIVRTDNMERTVLDAIPDRYSPDMEAQRIFDKMFDVDSKKSMYDSPRCGYDIDTSDGDDKPYPQKSLSEECEDLGVDSPSASDLFPEADILFGAPSPAHEQTIDQCNTHLDDQIATDQLLTHETRHEELDLNLDDVGEIVTVGEDGVATIPSINAEEFAKSHPNTTFHTEPEDGEITIAQPPFTIAQGIKARHITFHANRGQGTVMMAPQTTVISQATVSSNEPSNTVKFTDIDNMINSMPCPQPPSIPSVLKEPGMSTRPLPKFDGLKDPSIAAPRPLSKFDSLLTDSKVHHLSSNNSARQIVQGTQVIRRLRYDEKINTKSNTRFHFEEPRRSSVSDEVKMRNDRAIVESMGDNASSPGNPELFWDSTTTERHERRFHFSESEKVTKSPFDELLNDSSAYGPHTRLDSVIKAARPERTYERTSFEGISVSGSDESRPLRTYPPKRAHNQHTQDMERHFTLKTTTTTTHHHELDRSMTTKTTHHHDLDRTSKKTMPRCQESEGRRRTGRGLVKRGCSCCNGSSAPPKKRARPKKPPTDFTPNS